MPAQRMETPITIREAVLAIKARDYLLPAIQREFVWGPEKTESLFDSLMRGYPVGSFLFWKVAPESSQRYKFYEFMQEFHGLSKKRLLPFDIAEPKTLTVVLDGQQRLTSLAIGLLGYRADRERGRWVNNPAAYLKKRLYLNLALPYTSGDEVDREYDFRFLTDAEGLVRNDKQHWFPIKNVLQFVKSQDVDLAKIMTHHTENSLSPWGGQTLLKLCQVIIKDPVIHYFQEDEQALDRVLNIFVRLNSGGIPLSYSDLLLSIATAQWKTDARDTIYGLVDELNAFGKGFEFNKDFVLKCALVLTDRSSIKFSVENFDKENTKAIEDNWETAVRSPLLKAVELAAAFGYQGKTLTSANVLIPIAYYLKQIGSPANFVIHPDYADQRTQMRKWLLVSLLKSVFSSKTDTLLGAVRTAQQLSSQDKFPLETIEKALLGHGVSLKFSVDELEHLLDTEYGTRNTFSVLAAAYPALNNQFEFHMDHIFPKGGFDRRKLRRSEIAEAEIEFFSTAFNQLPNLQILVGVVNQAKLDSPFEEWIKPMQSDEDPSKWANYQGQHLIPLLSDYSLKNFKQFFEKRRALLLNKLEAELPISYAKIAVQIAREP